MKTIRKIISKFIFIIFISLLILLQYCNSKDNEYHLELEKYNTEIKKKPYDPWLYIDRGIFYLNNYNCIKAEKDFKYSVKLYESSFGYYHLAIAQLGLYQYQESLNAINKAVLLNKKSFSYVFIRGLANDLLGNKKEALSDYKFYLSRSYIEELANYYFIVYFRRSALLHDAGENKIAFQDINSAIKINKNNPDLYILRFLIQLNLKAYREAEKDLIKGLKRGFNDQEFLSEILREIDSCNIIRFNKIIEKYRNGKKVKYYMLNDKKYIVSQFLGKKSK